MKKAESILFVCMGNICRSPTAEAVFRSKAEAAGIAGNLRIDSAGTHDYHTGHAPDRRAQSAAAKRGYDMSALRARRVEPGDFSEFDLVLGMDSANIESLKNMVPPSSGAVIRPFCEFSAKYWELADIPDPYYGQTEDFEVVLDMVENAADGLVDKLRKDGRKD